MGAKRPKSLVRLKCSNRNYSLSYTSKNVIAFNGKITVSYIADCAKNYIYCISIEKHIP